MITIEDYFKPMEFDVVIRRGWFYCESDREGDCNHLAFVIADPNVIKKAHRS